MKVTARCIQGAGLGLPDRETRGDSIVKAQHCEGSSLEWPVLFYTLLNRGQHLSLPTTNLSKPLNLRLPVDRVLVSMDVPSVVNFMEKSGISYLQIKWRPLSVSTTPLISPGSSLKAASWKAGCMTPLANHPKSPSLCAELQSDSVLASSSRVTSPSLILRSCSWRICNASSFVRVTWAYRKGG